MVMPVNPTPLPSSRTVLQTGGEGQTVFIGEEDFCDRNLGSLTHSRVMHAVLKIFIKLCLLSENVRFVSLS